MNDEKAKPRLRWHIDLETKGEDALPLYILVTSPLRVGGGGVLLLSFFFCSSPLILAGFNLFTIIL